MRQLKHQLLQKNFFSFLATYFSNWLLGRTFWGHQGQLLIKSLYMNVLIILNRGLLTDFNFFFRRF